MSKFNCLFGITVLLTGASLPEQTNMLRIDGVPAGSGLNVVVYAPEGFSNRVELYSCTELLSGVWTVAVENLLPASASPAVWFTPIDDAGFFTAGNMDVDSDSDDICDGRETFVFHTDPQNADTDGDSMPDGWEVQYSLDPNDPAGDGDGDEMSNLEEFQKGTDPTLSDTDGDGFIDPYDFQPLIIDYPVSGEGVFNVVSTNRRWIRLC